MLTFFYFTDDVSEKRSTLSYVIINPSCDLKLEEGDVIYLIRPSPIKNRKTFLTRGNSIRSIRRKRSRGSVSSQQPTPSPQRHRHLITAPNDTEDESVENGTKSGAITPISQHPSISEENESYVDEMQRKANELFVGEIALHVPTANVINVQPVDTKDTINWQLGENRMNGRNFDFAKYFSKRVPSGSII